MRFDALYLKSCADGFYPALDLETVRIPSPQSVPPTNIANWKRVHYPLDYDWGFRLGAFAAYCQTSPELGLLWTHFSSSAELRKVALAPQYQILTQFNLDFIFPLLLADQFKSSFDFNYDQVNLSLSSSVRCGDCITITPTIALSLLSLDQSSHTKSSGSGVTPYDDAPPVTPPTFSLKNRLSGQYSGVGPLLGFSAKGCLWCGFSLTGDFCGSLYYGQNSHRASASFLSESFEAETENELSGLFKFHEKKSLVKPAAFVAVGGEWEGCLCDCVDATLKVMWESQIFFNQSLLVVNQLNNPAAYEGNDLTLQGLRLSFALHY